MNQKNPIIPKLLGRRSAAFAGMAISLLFIAAAAGCGGGSSPAQTSTSASLPSGFSRPSAGVVQQIDALGDTVDSHTHQPAPAPREADISQVTIRKDGQNLVFTMDVSGPLPDTRPPDTLAAEWGFLLDTNGDGKPDWGVYARFPVGQPNLSWGLYNEINKNNLSDQKFPGTMTHSGTTLTITLNASAIGSPKSFKWMAYTDDAEAPVQGQTTPEQQAGDLVPNNAWPTGSEWLPYP